MEKTGNLAIETHGLVKVFGKTRAVDGIDLSVETGGVYSVLGPNGAGKTTAMRILATLLRADGGSARVLGHDVSTEANAVRSKIGLTGQYASIDEDLTGVENLMLLSRLFGHSRAAAKKRTTDLLDAFGLADAGSRQVKTYSGGMRRRIDLAATIVVIPDLLFLDEPTTGLDPRSRSEVWEIVRALVANGTTVMLTTQYLDEADQLADRIAVIDRGKVIAEGTPGQLKSSVGSGSLHVRLEDPRRRDEARQILARVLGQSIDLEADPVALSGRVDDAGQTGHALVELAQAGITVAELSLGQPSLDEVFLALTGQPVHAEHVEKGQA